MANSSGQVGRNYMAHLTGAVYAMMPGEVNLHRGTQMAGIIRMSKSMILEEVSLLVMS